jgi:hypothetical protein
LRQAESLDNSSLLVSTIELISACLGCDTLRHEGDDEQVEASPTVEGVDGAVDDASLKTRKPMSFSY